MDVSERKNVTRDAIFAAASVLFSSRGFAGTTVRDIASEASVDPALIIRHFTSKEGLFLETMKLELHHESLFDGPIECLGESYIRLLIVDAEPTRSVFLALLRASDSAGVGSRLRNAHESEFVAPLAARLTGPDSDLRARLSASLVGGLLYSMWVVGDEMLLTADPEHVIRRYGALLQELITPSK